MTVLAFALGAALALALVQRWNARHPARPVRLRAPLDTLLHGLVPAAAVSPLALSEPLLPLLAFAAGFALDFDHPLFFRSLSFEVCSSHPTRPPAHSLLAAVLAGALVWWAAGSLEAGAVAFFSLALHILFDATDGSGVLWLYPARHRLRDLPFSVYVFFLAGLAVFSWLLHRAGAAAAG